MSWFNEVSSTRAPDADLHLTMLALATAAAFTAYLQPGAAPIVQGRMSRVQGVRFESVPTRKAHATMHFPLPPPAFPWLHPH